MDVKKILQRVIYLFRQGLHYQALELISQLLDSSPDDGKAWELKGLIEDALQWQRASTHSLETATTLIPISASGQYVLAKNYLETGRRSLARSVFSILLQRKDIPEKLLPAISSYLGQYSDLTHLALEACRKAVEIDSECAESWFGIACFMAKMDYPQEHIANVLRKAVMIDPEHRHYRIALGNLLKQIGQVNEAYLVVKAINIFELREIQCIDCLQKLIAIFSLANDTARKDICLKNMRSLQQTRDPNSSALLRNRFSDFLNK